MKPRIDVARASSRRLLRRARQRIDRAQDGRRLGCARDLAREAAGVREVVCDDLDEVVSRGQRGGPVGEPAVQRDPPLHSAARS